MPLARGAVAQSSPGGCSGGSTSPLRVSSRTRAIGFGEGNAASSGILVPITRDYSRYLEPIPHAVKRKTDKLVSSMGVSGIEGPAVRIMTVVSKPAGALTNADHDFGTGYGIARPTEASSVHGMTMSAPRTIQHVEKGRGS